MLRRTKWLAAFGTANKFSLYDDIQYARTVIASMSRYSATESYFMSPLRPTALKSAIKQIEDNVGASLSSVFLYAPEHIILLFDLQVDKMDFLAVHFISSNVKIETPSSGDQEQGQLLTSDAFYNSDTPPVANHVDNIILQMVEIKYQAHCYIPYNVVYEPVESKSVSLDERYNQWRIVAEEKVNDQMQVEQPSATSAFF